MEALAAIRPAPPQRTVRNGAVSDPLAIARESQIVGGNASQKRDKLFGRAVIADDFPALLHALNKQLLAIERGHSSGIQERPRGQLGRLGGSPAEETGGFP